ncbi:MAG: acyltransferase [Bacteroidota bacterium]
MKTGLGINNKLRKLLMYWNLFLFNWRKALLGFDVANQFLQRVDKNSVQLILRKNGASIGKDCDIETGLIFHNCKDYSNLIIGNNCHIGKNCFFDLRDKVDIKNNVVISMQCTFITHIDMNKSVLRNSYPSTNAPIQIRDNSYLGAKVTVLKGNKIGNNVIVAANSLINTNIENFCLIAGSPAKKIKDIS